jgi:hypothetical protein
VTVKVDGTFDRTGLPDPLLMDHCFTVAGDTNTGLSCRLGLAGWMRVLSHYPPSETCGTIIAFIIAKLPVRNRLALPRVRNYLGNHVCSPDVSTE